MVVQRVRAGVLSHAVDSVAEEVPVALEYNGVSHAVMLATPANLEDFGYGFSVTEGIVDSSADLLDCEVAESERGITLQLTINAACFARLKLHRRNLTGRTGCGLCGAESLSHAVRPSPRVNTDACFEAAAVCAAVDGLRALQPLQEATGATHAAAWCAASGHIVCLREDVGRHNALDKLIGAMLRSGAPMQNGFIVVSSRASYEMVQKAAVAGVGLLVALSGVTALAARQAEQAGVGLIGYARGSNFSIYSHPARIGRNNLESSA